jgi:translation initiation factor RLI1
VLGPIKGFPRPVDIVASNYHAQVKTELCKGHGICVERCPIEAVNIIQERVNEEYIKLKERLDNKCEFDNKEVYLEAMG